MWRGGGGERAPSAGHAGNSRRQGQKKCASVLLKETPLFLLHYSIFQYSVQVFVLKLTVPEPKPFLCHKEP